MGFVRDENRPVLGGLGVLPGANEINAEASPDFISDTLPAAFRLENTIGSSISNEAPEKDINDLGVHQFDRSFDPFEELDGYEENSSRFLHANTPAQVQAIKNQIDREQGDQRTLASSGLAGVAASLVAGVVDPVNLIPVGGQAYRSYRLGGSILKNGLSTAKAGLIGSTAAEAILSHTQETRTAGESAANIASATFLSGILGGSVGAVRHMVDTRRAGKLYDRTDADITARSRSADESVDIALSGLEKDLEKVTLDAGAAASDALGNPILRQNGEYKLDGNFGIAKVIVKHGTQSPKALDADNPHLVVTRDDVTAIPKVFREYEAEVFDNPDKGHKEWRWAVDRPSADGTPRQIVYSVRRFTQGDGKDHVVTVYTSKPGRELPVSEKRRSPVSASLSGLLRITEGYRNGAYRFAPKGAGGDAPNTNISPDGENVTPWQDLQGRVDSELTVPDDLTPDLLEPNSVKVRQDELVADTGADIGEELLEADDLPEIKRPELGEGGSVGAASLRENVAEERLKSALGVEKALSFQDPMLRVATSSSIHARRVMQELAETPLAYEKNALGVSTPIAVETRVKMYQAPLYESLTFMDDAFVRYRLGRKKQFGDIAKLGAQDLVGLGERSMLDYTAFRKEVSLALRRSDQHQIPEVAETAREFRSKVFDPSKEKAIQVGLLPEDIQVETASSYLTRMYDHQKIAAKRDEFTDTVARWLKTQEDKLDWDDMELFDLADEITDRILGTPDGRLPYDAHLETRRMDENPGHSVRGPLQAREFAIPDNLIEGFLENDISILAKSYTRTIAPDIEVIAQFGSIGMDEAIGDIRREFAQKAGVAKTEKARNKLQKEREAVIRDVSAVRDRIRGDYGMPADPNSVHVRVFRGIRNLNYIRLLGGMTLSAIPDIARPVMVHGMKRVFGDGFAPMVSNFKAYRMASNEVKLAGTALDMVLDSRSMAIADVLDNYGRNTAVERGLQAVTDRFGKVALMAPWNAAMKQFSGIITMTRMLQASDAIRNGGGKAKEIEKLATQGIDQSMAVRISEQFEQFGEINSGVYMANTAEWVDKEAVEAFRAGLVKEVDKIIITPGQDKPLWMSSETGKVIGQFKSFGLASTQRALISGLQDRDFNALSGAALMVGLGSLSYALKTWDAGREVSDDPTVWLTEGVDRSGLTGWLFEANNMVEKVTRGTVGVSALTGGPQMSRYQSRNILGSLVGPTAGTIKDISQAVGSAATGDWKKSDTRALRRLLPYQNLIGFRRLFDEAEKGINQSFEVR